MERLILDMIQDYQDLNPSYVEEFEGLPSALDFSSFVRRNRPVVFRQLGHGLAVPALEKWTVNHLCEKLGDKELSIAMTPKGDADAIIDGRFVGPHYTSMTMEAFLYRLVSREGNEVLYLQSQNDNLHQELEALLEEATTDVPFATEVFGTTPDATNVWIGDERSVTSLHKDPYENLYLVVQGTKTFDLLPPTEFYCLHEQVFPSGQYEYDDEQKTWHIRSNDSKTPWIPVDPAHADLDKYPRFKHARPLSVTLQRGDILYLPALWFHKVSQTPSDDPEVPLAIAVNWWYDLAYDSPTWTLARLVRKMALAADGRDEEEEL